LATARRVNTGSYRLVRSGDAISNVLKIRIHGRPSFIGLTCIGAGRIEEADQRIINEQARKRQTNNKLTAPVEPSLSFNHGWNHIRYSSHSHHPGDL
jgi:hypothetical protein